MKDIVLLDNLCHYTTRGYSSQCHRSEPVSLHVTHRCRTQTHIHSTDGHLDSLVDKLLRTSSCPFPTIDSLLLTQSSHSRKGRITREGHFRLIWLVEVKLYNTTNFDVCVPDSVDYLTLLQWRSEVVSHRLHSVIHGYVFDVSLHLDNGRGY